MVSWILFKEKENSEFKPVKVRLKIDLVSYPARAKGLVNMVKWFQVLLCIINNSIKHQLFVYTELNDQAVLFQIIQFSIIHLFALSLNAKQFYLTNR